MIGAFSPLESWVILLAVLLIAVAIGLVFASLHHDDEDRLPEAWVERWHREHR